MTAYPIPTAGGYAYVCSSGHTHATEVGAEQCEAVLPAERITNYDEMCARCGQYMAVGDTVTDVDTTPDLRFATAEWATICAGCTCTACGGNLGPDNVDRVCGRCASEAAGLEIAQHLAGDIARTAEQYPAIREAKSFDDLQSIYDANESVLAACEAVGYSPWDADGCIDEFAALNTATGEVDRVLRVGGWQALLMLAGDTF